MKEKKSDTLDARDRDTDDSIASFEAKWAAGFTKAGDGKHLMADGLVGRSGRRRIPPDARDEEEWDWWRWQKTDEVAAAAAEVLHQRNASVFQGLVLNPLQGKPKKSVESLAAQFGVPPARIHRILYDCKLKVKAKIDAKRVETQAFERTSADEVCRACGAVYSYGHFPSIKAACRGRRGHSPSPMEGLNPHCLILELARRRSEIEAAMRARKSAYEAKLEESIAKDRARWRAEVREMPKFVESFGLPDDLCKALQELREKLAPMRAQDSLLEAKWDARSWPSRKRLEMLKALRPYLSADDVFKK